MLTREEAKRRAELYSALADGKTIQIQCANGEWTDVQNNTLLCIDDDRVKYRIKPEPKYRPSKNQEERWLEMHKHPDFGWLVHKNTKSMYHVTVIYYDGICLDINENSLNYLEAFDYYEFLDGKPFGIKED